MYVCIYIYTYVYVYIYIYNIYRYIWRYMTSTTSLADVSFTKAFIKCGTVDGQCVAAGPACYGSCLSVMTGTGTAMKNRTGTLTYIGIV